MTFQLFIKNLTGEKDGFFCLQIFIILINVKYVYIMVINVKIPTITYMSLLCFRKREICCTLSIIKTQTKKTQNKYNKVSTLQASTQSAQYLILAIWKL